jgi:hypothetical protein
LGAIRRDSFLVSIFTLDRQPGSSSTEDVQSSSPFFTTKAAPMFSTDSDGPNPFRLHDALSYSFFDSSGSLAKFIAFIAFHCAVGVVAVRGAELLRRIVPSMREQWPNRKNTTENRLGLV